MYHLQMVEIKARMVANQREWYHLRMIEIKARMVVNQRECITYGW